MKENKAIPQAPLEWMPKSVWGPLLWRQLHCRALAYLPMAGEQEWFDGFVNSIPCPNCQHHFKLFVEKHPPNFSSRPSFYAWTISAHNYVRQSQGKNLLNLEDSIQFYLDMFLPDK